jgi:cation/acetate symporter
MAGFEHAASSGAAANAAFKSQLNKVYGWYTGGFIVFIILMAIAEQMGMKREWMGFTFLAATILLYAGIGIMSRTNDAAEYYVAGRRVPAVYNGMATGADWMSAASFIGMAGTLYLSGYGGLAFIMGWTGGYCLVALFLAPYLRKFGQFTIPDFLGARYGGNLCRLIGIFAAILCSFTYVVAQIYGVGLITTRLTGVDFAVGIFLGLGVPRRHARGDVDAGRAIHHPDHCVPDSGDLAVGQADRQPDSADELHLAVGQGHRKGKGAARRPERIGGHQDLQGAR